MKKNLIFAGKCLLAVLPFILVISYARTGMMRYADGEIPYYIWNREISAARQPEVYNTVILGDSCANAAYEPALLSSDTINLSLGGTSPIEGYYILKEWIETQGAPKDVFISYMDVHFLEDDCFWSRTLYSHRFQPRDVLEMFREGKRYQANYCLEVSSPEKELASYLLYLPNKYITAIMNASINQREQGNRNAYQTIDTRRGSYIAQGTKGFQSQTAIPYDMFLVAPIMDDYYHRLIQLALENDIKVHLVKLPLPEPSVFTSTYRQQVEAYYHTLQETYPDITFEWFDGGYGSELFADECHANIHGALTFSRELRGRYPELFSAAPVTQRQQDALSLCIASLENSLGFLFQWIEHTDYTVVLLDADNAFLETCPQDPEKALKSFGVDKTQPIASGTVYYGSGLVRERPNYTLAEAEGVLRLTSENGSVTDLGPVPSEGLLAIVLNNYEGSCVTAKYFQRDPGSSDGYKMASIA